MQVFLYMTHDAVLLTFFSIDKRRSLWYFTSTQEEQHKLDFYFPFSAYPEPKVIEIKKPTPKRPVIRKKPIIEPVKQVRKKRFNKKQLKNAVVMSEILAPPVSMREG